MRGLSGSEFANLRQLIQLNDDRGARLGALGRETRALVDNLRNRMQQMAIVGMELENSNDDARSVRELGAHPS
jgi:hypothetical protein